MSYKKRDLIVDEIDQELDIDPEDLNEELAHQPLLMRKYTRLASEVISKLRAVEDNLKYVEGKAYLKYKKEGGTIKEVEARVDTDDEVKQARQEVQETQALHKEYEGIVRSIMQRHDALKEICANIRKEMVD